MNFNIHRKMVLVNIRNFLAKLLFESIKPYFCKFSSKTDEQETNSFLLHKLLPMNRFATTLIGLLNHVQKS